MVFRQHYPLPLAQELPPSLTADRAHNDILDRLLSSGLLGLVAYLYFLYVLFTHGIGAIGFDTGPQERRRFLLLFWGATVAGVIVTTLYRGIAFLGIGVQAGLIIGILGYLTFGAQCARPASTRFRSAFFIGIGLFAGIVSHIGETAVCFQVSVTRLYFSLYAGILVAMSARHDAFRSLKDQGQNILSITENGHSGGLPKRMMGPDLIAIPRWGKTLTRRLWQEAVLAWRIEKHAVALSILAGMILSMVAFDFLWQMPAAEFNAETDELLLSFSKSPFPGSLLVYGAAYASPSRGHAVNLMVYVGLMFLLWLWFAVFLSWERMREGLPDAVFQRTLIITLIISLSILGMGLCSIVGHFFMVTPKEVHISNNSLVNVCYDVLRQSQSQAHRIIFFYAWVWASLFLLSLALMPRRPTGGRLRTRRLIAVVLLMTGVPYLVWTLGIKPVEADMLSARGVQWRQGVAAPILGEGSKTSRLSLTVALVHLHKALQKAPYVSSYWMNLSEVASALAPKVAGNHAFFKTVSPVAPR